MKVKKTQLLGTSENWHVTQKQFFTYTFIFIYRTVRFYVWHVTFDMCNRFTVTGQDDLIWISTILGEGRQLESIDFVYVRLLDNLVKSKGNSHIEERCLNISNASYYLSFLARE